MDHLMSPRTTDRLKRTARIFKMDSDPLFSIIGAVIRWYADQDPNTQARVLLHGFHTEMAPDGAPERKTGEQAQPSL